MTTRMSPQALGGVVLLSVGVVRDEPSDERYQKGQRAVIATCARPEFWWSCEALLLVVPDRS